MIFDGFEPTAAAPCHRDEHDLNLSSDHTQEIAPVSASALNPEQIAPPEDGKLNPGTGATDSAMLEPHTDPISSWACVTGTSDSSSAIGSGLRTSASIEPDWVLILEFSSTDIFRHSPLGDVLNSLKSLSLLGDSWPNYVRLEWEADDEELRCPPTTHLIATVDELTDMLDFDSDDIHALISSLRGYPLLPRRHCFLWGCPPYIYII